MRRDEIVVAARGWLGTPYRHQASRKGAGCDCLGLVRGVWRELVGPEPARLPPYTPDWAEVTGEKTLLQPRCWNRRQAGRARPVLCRSRLWHWSRGMGCAWRAGRSGVSWMLSTGAACGR